jgi:hypothetical protein
MIKKIGLLALGLSLLAVGYVLSDKGLHAPSTAALQELEMLCGNSKQTTATVDSNYVMRSMQPSKNTFPTREFDFVYHYTVDGKVYDGAMTLDSVLEAKTIAVWYVPSQPKVHARTEPCASLAALQPNAVPDWYLYLGIPMAIAGFLLVYRQGRQLLGRAKAGA